MARPGVGIVAIGSRRARVEALGGRFAVQSEPGAGTTTLAVELPLAGHSVTSR
jgi:signal transduction histidine kinase